MTTLIQVNRGTGERPVIEHNHKFWGEFCYKTDTYLLMECTVLSATCHRGGGHNLSSGWRHQRQAETGDQAPEGGDGHDQGLLEIKTDLRKSLVANAMQRRL